MSTHVKETKPPNLYWIGNDKLYNGLSEEKYIPSGDSVKYHLVATEKSTGLYHSYGMAVNNHYSCAYYTKNGKNKILLLSSHDRDKFDIDEIENIKHISIMRYQNKDYIIISNQEGMMYIISRVSGKHEPKYYLLEFFTLNIRNLNCIINKDDNLPYIVVTLDDDSIYYCSIGSGGETRRHLITHLDPSSSEGTNFIFENIGIYPKEDVKTYVHGFTSFYLTLSNSLILRIVQDESYTDFVCLEGVESFSTPCSWVSNHNGGGVSIITISISLMVFHEEKVKLLNIKMNTNEFYSGEISPMKIINDSIKFELSDPIKVQTHVFEEPSHTRSHAKRAKSARKQ